MLMLLSPAKSLDYDTPVRTTLASQPQFTEQAAELIRALVKLSPSELADLMHISADLAQLNARRYAEWQPDGEPSNARQAVLAFNGDVYEGLQAATLSDAQLQWAQDHLAILSGLYGVLRPLDLMQPYRLEMGTKLHASKLRVGGDNTPCASLYAYWGDRIAAYLNAQLATHAQPWVLNLASEEYFRAVNLKVLRAPVVQCVFQDYKNDTWKVISFYAKRARGLMARYVITQRIETPTALRDFADEGYACAAEVSSDTKLIFRRRQS